MTTRATTPTRSFSSPSALREMRAELAAARAKAAAAKATEASATTEPEGLPMISSREREASVTKIQAQFRGVQAREKQKEQFLDGLEVMEQKAAIIQAAHRGNQARAAIAREADSLEEPTQPVLAPRAGPVIHYALSAHEQISTNLVSFKRAIQAGIVTERTPVWRETMAEWARLSDALTSFGPDIEDALFLHAKSAADVNQAAAKIQSNWRGNADRQVTRGLQVSAEASTTIQAAWRAKSERKKHNFEIFNGMLVLDESAAWIQAHFRGFRARKHVAAGNHSFAEDDEISHGLRILNSTSTTLQKHWRGRQARASPSASTPPREHDEGSRSSSSVHHDLTYYYVAAGQRMGPVRTANLIAMERSAMLTADTLVWRKGMAEWLSFSTVFPDEV